MVTKERAVEILLQNFQESDVIKKLGEYLLDKREDAPSEKEFSSVNLYMEDLPVEELKCFDRVGGYIDCEAGRVLKKLAIYILNSNHKSSLSFFSAIREKYSLLKEIGASEEVVKRVLIYGYRLSLEERSIKILLLTQEEVVDFYMKNGINSILTREMEVLVKILSVLLNSVRKEDKLDIEIEKKYRERFDEARIIFEKIVEGCFKNKFKTRVGKVRELVQKYEEFDKLLEIFESDVKFKLEFPHKQGERELITRIIEENSNLTTRGKLILKAYIILEEKEFIYNEKNMESALSLIEKIELGDRYVIDYFYHIDLSNYFTLKKVERYVDGLIEKNIDIVKGRVFASEEKRDIKSCYLFGRLVEKNRVSDEEKREYLEWFENKIVTLCRDEVIDKYKVEFENESEKDFNFLKDRNFKEVGVKVTNRVYEMEKILELCYDTLYLADYTCVGINLIKLTQLLPISKKKITFLDGINLSCVRKKDSDERVDERIIRYYLAEYIKSEERKIVSSCQKINELVNISDLRELVYDIYRKWLDGGENSSLKNILIPMALLSSPTQLEMLKKQVKLWAENSKPGLAGVLIQCIAIRGDKISLTYVDDLAKNFKNKRIKTLAQDSLEKTAKLYGIDLEELEERIIPDFDFDRERMRYFNYGERKIKAKLDGNLEITLFDNTGKQIKSLPKASAKYNDDENLVAECKEELKVIKKQLKTVTDLQKFKVQRAIIMRREWEVKRWQEIFIDNPIMNIFAISLIWEERDREGKVLGRFRYMEDGSFNTVDEDEYELQGESFITPANLREMSVEEVKGWREQLEDYEVIQPVEQLNMELLNLNDEEREGGVLKIFTEEEFSPTTFKKVMDKYNFKYEEDYFTRVKEATYTDSKRGIDINIILEEPIMIRDYEGKGKINRVTFTKSETFKNRYSLKDIPMELIDYVYYIIRELF